MILIFTCFMMIGELSFKFFLSENIKSFILLRPRHPYQWAYPHYIFLSKDLDTLTYWFTYTTFSFFLSEHSHPYLWAYPHYLVLYYPRLLYFTYRILSSYLHHILLMITNWITSRYIITVQSSTIPTSSDTAQTIWSTWTYLGIARVFGRYLAIASYYLQKLGRCNFLGKNIRKRLDFSHLVSHYWCHLIVLEFPAPV